MQNGGFYICTNQNEATMPLFFFGLAIRVSIVFPFTMLYINTPIYWSANVYRSTFLLFHFKDQFLLPDWFACLVSISTFAEDFNLKAICMHTLLDLIFASFSIHGWPDTLSLTTSDFKPTGLLLPVLSPNVLHHLAHTLIFFPVSLSSDHIFSTIQVVCLSVFGPTSFLSPVF